MLVEHSRARRDSVAMRERVMYVELKTNQNDRGPAWIGRVRFSKSGRTIYYRDLELRSLKGMGVGANFYDVESDDEYWVSGVKKNGQDRHWAGRGPVHIDEDAQEEYDQIIGGRESSP